MNRTDEELMQALAAEDLTALDELYRRHAPNLIRFAGRWRATLRDAEDIVQETFLQVWEHRHRYVERQRFKPWLLRICLNLCYDRLRSRESVRAMSGDNDGVEPVTESFEERVMDRNEAECVRTLVNDLAETDRLLLNLRVEAGLTVAETAETLGCSIRTIHYRMAGILERLRRKLEVES